METPLISVIVPIYSTDRYTGMCIESILNQTYKNLEIILVDDGSVDRCPEICDLYATKDSRIKVIHKANGGLVSGRKAGMKVATGEFIGYVDGDDWIARGYFENIYHEIEKNNPDVVVCNWTRAFFDQHVIIYNSTSNGYYSGQDLSKLKTELISKGQFYKPGISTYVWNKVFRRNLVYDCQMAVNEKLMTGEDACVSYAAILKSKSLSIINNPGYYYRQHEDSMLKKKSNYPLEIERMKILYNNLMSFAGHDRRLCKQIEDYVLASCIIRTGGIYPGSDHFIFGERFVGKKVVVYGAGSFGQLFVSQLFEQNICQVVGWLDDDYWEYRRSCLNVDPVESVADKQFDYLLIASVDGEIADNITNRLKKYQISLDKILKLVIPENQRYGLLKKYIGEEEK